MGEDDENKYIDLMRAENRLERLVVHVQQVFLFCEFVKKEFQSLGRTAIEVTRFTKKYNLKY